MGVRKLIARKSINESMAKLIGFGYEFTWTNEQILAASARLSGWSIHEWPLSQALDQLRSTNIDLLPLLHVMACFLADLERQNIPDEKIRELVQICLSRLGVRSDRSRAFQILRRDLSNFVDQRLGHISSKTIPAFLDWLSHYNAVSIYAYKGALDSGRPTS
jgi:hypothetical protein